MDYFCFLSFIFVFKNNNKNNPRGVCKMTPDTSGTVPPGSGMGLLITVPY